MAITTGSATNHHFVKMCDMSTDTCVIAGRLVEPFCEGNCLKTLTKTGMTNVTSAIITSNANDMTTAGIDHRRLDLAAQRRLLLAAGRRPAAARTPACRPPRRPASSRRTAG